MEKEKVALPVYGINTAALLNPEPLIISSEQISLPPEVESFTCQFPKGFTMTGTATIEEGDREALNSISRLFHDSDSMVTLTPDGSSLSRKMKKALHQGQRYHRDTKWKRKAARWQQRHSVKLLGSWTEDEEGITFRGKPIE